MTVQFSKTDFLPPLWLRNAHLQTILPRYIAKTRLIIIARYLKTHWHKVMLRLIM